MRILTALLLSTIPFAAYGQAKPPGPAQTQLAPGITPIVGGVNGDCLTVNGVVLGQAACGSGGGSPGGSTTQVQYNNAGSFGGISGATSNGTTITLVAPILGTPASATLTNATGLPISTGVSGLGTGVATFLGTPSSANLLAALTTSTGTGSAVFGTAPTISSLNATTAATLAFITGSTQCLHVNTSGVISGTGSDCGSGSGAVTSVTGGVGLTVTPTTGAVVVSAPVTQRNNTATTDTLINTDAGTAVTENNASAVAVGIAQAGTTGFASGQYWTLKNKGAGLVTLTPTTSTIDGAATFALSQNQSVDFYSDGTNYITLRGPSTATIASGTAALGTSAISAGACGTATTVSATGVVTTDRIKPAFQGDPTATTGYLPTAMLTIVPYPTANNVNFKQCNLTSSSITPSALTINWDVQR